MYQITANNKCVITQNIFNGRSHGGYICGHIGINHDRENASCNLFSHYFSRNPLFPAMMFRRRFWMSRNLFLYIYDTIQRHDNYFVQRRDGLGRLGLSGL